VGGGADRSLGRLPVEGDGAIDARDRSGKGEVMSELGQNRRAIVRVETFERLGDAQVRLGAARAAQLVVKGASHELVSEAVTGGRAGNVLEHAGGRGLVDDGRVARRRDQGCEET